MKIYWFMVVLCPARVMYAGGGNSKMLSESQMHVTAPSNSQDAVRTKVIYLTPTVEGKAKKVEVRIIDGKVYPMPDYTKSDYEFALLDAAKNNKHQAFIVLLKLPDINVNLTDVTGETLLMLAAKHGNAQAVSLLLEKGANLNAVNTFITPHKTVQEYAIPSTSEHVQIQRNKEAIRKMLEEYKKTRHTNIVQALDELSLQGPSSDIAKIIESY